MLSFFKGWILKPTVPINFALWKENCLFIHSNSDSHKYLYFSHLTTYLFSFIFAFFEGTSQSVLPQIHLSLWHAMKNEFYHTVKILSMKKVSCETQFSRTDLGTKYQGFINFTERSQCKENTNRINSKRKLENTFLSFVVTYVHVSYSICTLTSTPPA